MGEIRIVAREMTDEEWVDVISLAMASDLDRELRRKVVQELVDMRQARRLRHDAIAMKFASPDTASVVSEDQHRDQSSQRQGAP